MKSSANELLSQLAARRLPVAELTNEKIPSLPGIYAVWCDEDGWHDLVRGYEEVVGFGALPAVVSVEPAPAKCEGPLYIVKAQKSLRARDWRTHFGAGKTHQSTLRRSLAVLLGLTKGWKFSPRSAPVGGVLAPLPLGTFDLPPRMTRGSRVGCRSICR